MKIFDWHEIHGDDGLLDANVVGLPKRVALTIGVFDGVHRGHQELIRLIQEAAGAEYSLVVTFRSHPMRLLAPERYPGDVMTLRQKLRKLAALGVDGVLLIDFSREFSTLSGTEFVSRLATLFDPALVALGSNFHCGYNGDTNAERVRALLGGARARVDIVQPVIDNGIPVSSTRIRSCLRHGDLRAARALLGSAYRLDLVDVPLDVPSGENHEARIIPVDRFRQVLPPAGSYEVDLMRAENHEDRAVVVIETGNMRVPNDPDVEEIRFVTP